MVDPESLTLGATAAAMVATAATETVGRTVDTAMAALGRLVGWLRERFSAEEWKEGATALARVEEVPDSPRLLEELAKVLDGRVGADPGFRSELEGLVKHASGAGVDVGSITQTVWGDRNVQNAGLTNSDVTVTYGQVTPPGR